MTEASQPDQRTLDILSDLSYRTGELNHYLQEIATRVSELTGVDWSVITFCQNDTEQILASSIDLGDRTEQVYSLHGTVTGTVVKTGNCLIVEDTTSCQDYGAAPAGYRAYLGVPLRTPEGKVIGTVCSFHTHPRQFSAEDVQMVRILAERAATALDNYQLYQKQQQMNVQLQAEIRERQAAEALLRKSEEQLRQITENLEQVCWIYSHDGQPIYISPGFETVWGYPLSAWYNDPNFWWKVIHPDDQERVYNAYYHGCDRHFDEEYRMIRPDGMVRILRDQAFPIFDATGQIYRIVGITEDVTNRRQAEQERLKAIASLAEVGELAAMIVHEIRNPLTTILMGLDACQRANLSPVLQERLSLSLDEGDRLRHLLSEILLYAKPQVMVRSPLELNQFLSAILDSIRTLPAALNRRVELIPASDPVCVFGDPDKLKQVLINLTDNACDAVAEGETITWRLITNAATRQVSLQVHNGGAVIPPDVLTRLTKPFYTTKESGTGLGLAIVKRIVQAHDGDVVITSNSATGTTVSINLPLADLAT